MDSVRADEVKKRRLPPWMMGAACISVVREENKGDRVGTSVDVGSEVRVPKSKTRARKIVKRRLCEDEETCIKEEVSVPKTRKKTRKVVKESLDEHDEAQGSEDVKASELNRRSKRCQKRTLGVEEEANTDGSCVLVKCDNVKRTQKTSSEVEDSDVDNIGSEKSNQIADRKKKKKKKGNINKLALKEVSSSCADNGRELLMEDLISIAEEYVKAESLTEQQTFEGSGLEEKPSAVDHSFAQSASSLDDAQAKCKSAVTELRSSSPTPNEQMKTTTSSNISGTGDAAQDMLNLLLGPLLTKPVEESYTTLNSDDMLFDRPAQNHSRNHTAEDVAPPVKKKSSLKDKVAMFF